MFAALTRQAIHTFFASKKVSKKTFLHLNPFFIFCPMQSYGVPCNILQYFRRGLTLRRLKRLAPHRTRFARLRRGGSLRLTSLLGKLKWGGYPCHRLLRFARNRFRPRGANRALLTPRKLIYFIQKVPFSFLKRWRVLGRRKNLFFF